MFSKKMIVKIEGMHCEHCKKSVEDGLKRIDNIKGVKVDLNSGLATISYKNTIDINSIKKVIEDLDFNFAGVE